MAAVIRLLRAPPRLPTFSLPATAGPTPAARRRTPSRRFFLGLAASVSGGVAATSASARPQQGVSPVELILKDVQWPEQFPFKDEDFSRFDESPDTSFYSEPRFVTHIDDPAIAALTKYYAEVFPPSNSPGVCMLDLCSSWVSHFPAGYRQDRVVGMGMNEAELKRNPLQSKMGALQGLVICRPAVNAKIAGVSALPVKTSITKEGLQRSGFWGLNAGCRVVVKTGVPRPFDHDRTGRFICCSSSSSSDGNNNLSWNFNEKDEEYVNSTVIEAVEVRSGSDGFMIKMRDGRHLRCVHNTPQEGQLPDYAPHPAIVLKMDDGSDILLPIIVLEMPTIMLMAAVRNIQIARPTIYNIVKEMVDKMGYEVRLVRVTKRVHEAYFAQLYLAKVDNGKEYITLDLRPSDAINIAVRCKVPIQVNKHLAQCDGMRVIKPSKPAMLASLPSEGLLFTKLDRPDGHPCLETKEFILVRNMLIAAVEERYGDAAQWRDKLRLLRTKRGNST